MQEYFLSLLFLLHFVAETKSSYHEQLHSHAWVVYNSFWFRGTGIGLATKNRRCKEYFLSLLFLLHFVAETKSSYHEQKNSGDRPHGSGRENLV